MDVKMLKKCPVSEACGGCQLQGISYDEQLRLKQTKMEKLLGSFCKVNPIIGCDDPYYYRNKVQISFGKDYKGRVICGNYVASTHPVVSCLPIPKKVSLVSAAVLHRRRTLSEGYAP